eukprot:XP_020407791.1 grpE protein homolog 2, mitochondrial [Zea mays]
MDAEVVEQIDRAPTAPPTSSPTRSSARAELRESKLMNKYNELKEAGKLDAFMERRRSKNASKDHWKRRTKRIAFSDSDSEDLDLSKEDLVKLLLEKDGSLKSKDKEFKDMKDKEALTMRELGNTKIVATGDD